MKDGDFSDWSHQDMKEIIDRVQKGDLNAFGEVYKMYSPKIFRRCAFMLKDHQLAEDAVHDIFIKMLMKIQRLKEGIVFEAWFNRLVYNHCIDLLRKKDKHFGKEIEEKDSAEENLAVVIEQLEEDKKLTETLRIQINKLSEIDRSIISMYYWEGYSVKEISDMLEIGESAVKMRMKRSRDSIKSNLGNRPELYVNIAVLMILELI